MGILDSNIRTFKCDGAGCDKSIVFDRKDEQATGQDPNNAWLKGIRIVMTNDNRALLYCSDACEVEGVGTGKHNLPEPPKIAQATNPAQVEAAAKLAAARAQAEKAIREGTPTNIQLTD